jgi:hypothetical protein
MMAKRTQHQPFRLKCRDDGHFFLRTPAISGSRPYAIHTTGLLSRVRCIAWFASNDCRHRSYELQRLEPVAILGGRHCRYRGSRFFVLNTSIKQKHPELHHGGKQHDTYTDEDRFRSKVCRGQHCPSLRTIPIARNPRPNDERDQRHAQRAAKSRHE